MNLKNLFFLTIISWSLGIMACEPDPPTEPETLNYPFTLEDTLSTPEVEQTIDKFIAYLENPRPHELEPMNIRDVVWSVEATLNRTYTNVAHEFGDLSIKTHTISINRSDSTMSASDIILFYNDALDSLASHYYSLPDDNRLPVVIDVTESEVNPNILTVITHIGTGISSDVTANFDYHWRWGFDEGTCGPNIDDLPLVMEDAADRLAKELNSRVLAINDLSWICPTQVDCRWYTTDVETQDVIRYDEVPNEADDVQGDNYRDYLIYRNEWDGFDNYYDNLCLSPDELSFYFSSAVQVIEAFRPNPPNSDFIDISITPVKQQYDPNDTSRYNGEHIHSISYGKITYVSGPPGIIF